MLINKCQLVPGNIQLPKASSSFFQRDYFHRLATIDFSIMFQQWLAANNYKLKSLFLYFNKQYLGEKIIADTKVIIQGKTIEPDLVGIYQAK